MFCVSEILIIISKEGLDSIPPIVPVPQLQIFLIIVLFLVIMSFTSSNDYIISILLVNNTIGVIYPATPPGAIIIPSVFMPQNLQRLLLCKFVF